MLYSSTVLLLYFTSALVPLNKAGSRFEARTAILRNIPPEKWRGTRILYQHWEFSPRWNTYTQTRILVCRMNENTLAEKKKWTIPGGNIIFFSKIIYCKLHVRSLQFLQTKSSCKKKTVGKETYHIKGSKIQLKTKKKRKNYHFKFSEKKLDVLIHSHSNGWKMWFFNWREQNIQCVFLTSWSRK